MRLYLMPYLGGVLADILILGTSPSFVAWHEYPLQRMRRNAQGRKNIQIQKVKESSRHRKLVIRRPEQDEEEDEEDEASNAKGHSLLEIAEMIQAQEQQHMRDRQEDLEFRSIILRRHDLLAYRHFQIIEHLSYLQVPHESSSVIVPEATPFATWEYQTRPHLYSQTVDKMWRSVYFAWSTSSTVYFSA